ncbi:uncharacterized protein MONOS_18392 [Monocercomonoides exilis]|uniref:uncharacterized protein n=1 Tax=Monocercomonoides exilis TaxID=2049356 RepID=UPI003559E937|nr:hypothetical protein MONOS_18392 [Monocercomonoides exilis]
MTRKLRHRRIYCPTSHQHSMGLLLAGRMGAGEWKCKWRSREMGASAPAHRQHRCLSEEGEGWGAACWQHQLGQARRPQLQWKKWRMGWRCCGRRKEEGTLERKKEKEGKEEGEIGRGGGERERSEVLPLGHREWSKADDGDSVVVEESDGREGCLSEGARAGLGLARLSGDGAGESESVLPLMQHTVQGEHASSSFQQSSFASLVEKSGSAADAGAFGEQHLCVTGCGEERVLEVGAFGEERGGERGGGEVEGQSRVRGMGDRKAACPVSALGTADRQKRAKQTKQTGSQTPGRKGPSSLHLLADEVCRVPPLIQMRQLLRTPRTVFSKRFLPLRFRLLRRRYCRWPMHRVLEI